MFLSILCAQKLDVSKIYFGGLTFLQFDCSFPALSCEFASVDVSDVLGTVSLHLLILLSEFFSIRLFVFFSFACRDNV